MYEFCIFEVLIKSNSYVQTQTAFLTNVIHPLAVCTFYVTVETNTWQNWSSH